MDDQHHSHVLTCRIPTARRLLTEWEALHGSKPAEQQISSLTHAPFGQPAAPKTPQEGLEHLDLPWTSVLLKMPGKEPRMLRGVLRESGCKTIGQIANRGSLWWSDRDGCGSQTIEAIRKLCAFVGVQLPDESSRILPQVLPVPTLAPVPEVPAGEILGPADRPWRKIRVDGYPAQHHTRLNRLISDARTPEDHPFETVGQIVASGLYFWIRRPGMGKTTLRQLEQLVKNAGLELKPLSRL